MKIEIQNTKKECEPTVIKAGVGNEVTIKEAFVGVTIETREGKQLNICLRDWGGPWHHIDKDEDFKI